MTANIENGWELSKENIQPFKTGRKMSFLTHSLDKYDEGEVAKMHETMEVEIKDYEGPDPIEPWLKYIQLMEQSCPSEGKLGKKYEEVLNRCVQVFIKNSQYKEDKRFVEIYLKALQNLSPSKRVEMIKFCIGRGIGKTVSKTYLALAEALEANQNSNEASQVLRKGIDENAQPVETLQHALNDLQYRVAQRIAESLQRGDEESLRNFGANVPVCKLTNEAQNVRVALSPGNPCRAKPVQKKGDPKLAIFQGFEDRENVETFVKPTAPMPLPSKEIEMKENEQENIIKPNKWCNEFLPPPPPFSLPSLPPVEIYVDEPENQPRSEDLKRKIGKRVLSERKVHPVPHEDAFQSILEPKISYRKDKLYQGRDREISFEHIRSKMYMKKVGVTTIRALTPTERSTSRTTERILQSKLRMPVGSGRSQRRKEPEARIVDESPASVQLRKEMNELKKQFMDLGSEMKDKMKFIEDQRTVIFQLEGNLASQNSANQALEVELMKLVNHIKQQESLESRLRQENHELQNALLEERKLVEQLKMEKEHMRRQFEEERQKLENEFERERQESLLSFRIDQHRSILQEELHVTAEFKKETSPQPAKTFGTVIPNPTPAPQRLGFTLYESNMDMIEEDVQPVNLSAHNNPQQDVSRHFGSENGGKQASNFATDEFAMPPPMSIPKSQVKPFEEDKENMSLDGNRGSKLSRPLTGILQPSTSAEPMELIYNDEEEIIQKKEAEIGDDFNVTDLTRALQLYPRPLLGSTPERIYNDETCNLPVEMNSNRRRRAFGAPPSIPRLDMEAAEPQVDEAYKMNMEPLVYEDEQNAGPQRENPTEYLNHLSPIAEASKERWSSCTSSSSSTNMTNTRGTVNFSVGSSYNVTKSVPRLVGRFPGSQQRQDAFQPPRSYTFDNHSQNQN